MKKSPQQLEFELSIAAKGAVSEGDVTVGLLQMLCETLNCQWATYWKVDPKRVRLVPFRLWELEPNRASPLHKDTVAQELSLSQGNAGHVWRSRRPIWTNNLVIDMCLPRSLDAEVAGFRGGIWFALKTDRAVYGVLEFLGTNIETVSDESLLLIEQFGISLGKLIEQNEHAEASDALQIGKHGI